MKPLVQLVFAIPKKRLNSATIFINQIAEVVKEQTEIIILINNVKSRSLLEGQLPANTRIIDVSDFYLEKVAKNENTDVYKESLKSNLFHKISHTIKMSLKEKFIEVARSLSLGYIDKLLEQIYVFKVSYIASGIGMKLQLEHSSNVKKRVIFFLESDRGIEFEYPVLYLRSQYDQCNTVIIEFADTATERDLIPFAKEVIRKPILNRYRRSHTQLFDHQAFQNRLYLSVPFHKALKILDIESIFPWRVGLNKWVDFVFVRRPEIIQQIKNLSYPTDKFFYEGDTIADSILMNSEFRKDRQTKPYSKAIIALPQYLETPREFSKRNYKKIKIDIEKLVIAIANIAEEITICLHPKQSVEDYRFLVEIPKVKISSSNLYKEIARHDFLVSTESSVMKYAWILKKPNILYFPKYWKLNEIYSEINLSRPWTMVIEDIVTLNRDRIFNFFSEAEDYFASENYANEIQLQKLDGFTAERIAQRLNLGI